MRRRIKCVVWDLDDTLWQGTLLEGDIPVLKPRVRSVICALDDRGILQSVASKNDFAAAWDRLVAFGLHDYFLHPQIGWASKSDSLRIIAERLGIAIEAVALVDDQPFELDEVRFYLPEVMTIDGADVDKLLHLSALQPPFVTNESKLRRHMYQTDIRRKQDEEEFDGTREEFLSTLAMVVTIRVAGEQDLRRAEELTIRTNQLNTTGRTYSYAELHALLHSHNHLLLVAELTDRYGTSGTIGLALIERGADDWLVKLLITSCRVISRGVGGIMLGHILRSAKNAGARLRVEFVPNSHNRIMYVTYKFNDFFEVSEQGGVIVLEHPLDTIRPLPPYITVNVPDEH
jgi:FkbH-like protein